MACEAMRAGTAPHPRSVSLCRAPLGEWGSFESSGSKFVSQTEILRLRKFLAGLRAAKARSGDARVGDSRKLRFAPFLFVMAGLDPAIHALLQPFIGPNAMWPASISAMVAGMSFGCTGPCGASSTGHRAPLVTVSRCQSGFDWLDARQVAPPEILLSNSRFNVFCPR